MKRNNNTDEVLKLVQERLKEGDIKSVGVASTSGKTGLKFARSQIISLISRFWR